MLLREEMPPEYQEWFIYVTAAPQWPHAHADSESRSVGRPVCVVYLYCLPPSLFVVLKIRGVHSASQFAPWQWHSASLQITRTAETKRSPPSQFPLKLSRCWNSRCFPSLSWPSSRLIYLECCCAKLPRDSSFIHDLTLSDFACSSHS